MVQVLLLFLIMLTVSSHLIAQGVINTEIKKDSSEKKEILIQNIFHKNLQGLQLIINPEYNRQSRYLILNSDYNTIEHFYFAHNNLNTFEKGMNQLLLIGYKDLTKYDLGVIGKYLGISKNMLAIILAILSTM